MKTTYSLVKGTVKVITPKALGTVHAQHFSIAERSIYDSCRFDIGRFRAEPTNYERCLHPRPSDTLAYCSADNNSFLRPRVIHELKSVSMPRFLSEIEACPAKTSITFA